MDVGYSLRLGLILGGSERINAGFTYPDQDPQESTKEVGRAIRMVHIEGPQAIGAKTYGE